jgi:hypothetical protein
MKNQANPITDHFPASRARYRKEDDMNNHFYRIITIGAFVLSIAALAAALWSNVRAQEGMVMAIPTTLNYQGYLREPDGSLTNGVFKITARIYSTPTGESPLYTTVLDAVNVRDGLFNIVLGDSPPLPGSVFANAPLYIGISLNDLTELIPRQRLHAVPWAFQASTLVNNAAISGFTSNGDVTINGSTVLNGSASITGSVTAAGSLDVVGEITARDAGSIISPGDGYWGSWWSWTYCPQYTYVCGATVRIESSQGGGDDTAMNGIKLACCSLGKVPNLIPVSTIELEEIGPVKDAPSDEAP